MNKGKAGRMNPFLNDFCFTYIVYMVFMLSQLCASGERAKSIPQGPYGYHHYKLYGVEDVCGSAFAIIVGIKFSLQG